ncbi:MAG: pyridoxine 5'-phosphate synthase [Candidatus Sumerlaeia bacterium]|nr:pyridoxine 5'-phosphate synthase [Candidatus Sumerlaeia bacterium]
MIKLSVNVNKIATLRNSRGGRHPQVLEFAELSLQAGAHGITVHPRPDERHIRRSDATALAAYLKGRTVLNSSEPVEFNIEGYPDDRYLELVAECRPHQATLVPDPPNALTSNAGWDVIRHQEFLREVVAQLKKSAHRVSLFLEPDLAQVEAAAATGADRIEFYTEPFAVAYEEGRGAKSFEVFNRAAQRATELGLGINAGHDLNTHNLQLLRNLHGLQEVSIGHALVVDALRMGWTATIHAYLKALAGPAAS